MGKKKTTHEKQPQAEMPSGFGVTHIVVRAWWEGGGETLARAAHTCTVAAHGHVFPPLSGPGAHTYTFARSPKFPGHRLTGEPCMKDLRARPGFLKESDEGGSGC